MLRGRAGHIGPNLPHHRGVLIPASTGCAWNKAPNLHDFLDFLLYNRSPLLYNRSPCCITVPLRCITVHLRTVPLSLRIELNDYPKIIYRLSMDYP